MKSDFQKNIKYFINDNLFERKILLKELMEKNSFNTIYIKKLNLSYSKEVFLKFTKIILQIVIKLRTYKTFTDKVFTFSNLKIDNNKLLGIDILKPYSGDIERIEFFCNIIFCFVIQKKDYEFLKLLNKFTPESKYFLFPCSNLTISLERYSCC
jgi:hypothetical protein